MWKSKSSTTPRPLSVRFQTDRPAAPPRPRTLVLISGHTPRLPFPPWPRQRPPTPWLLDL